MAWTVKYEISASRTGAWFPMCLRVHRLSTLAA
jgi:hypothetical protein